MDIKVRVWVGGEIDSEVARLEGYVARGGCAPLSRHPVWPTVLARGLGQAPYCLEAVRSEGTCGLLPLSYVRSCLFGRFLVSMPYLNYGGVIADDDYAVVALVDGAIALADRLGVRYLELRQERAIEHVALSCPRVGG